MNIQLGASPPDPASTGPRFRKMKPQKGTKRHKQAHEDSLPFANLCASSWPFPLPTALPLRHRTTARERLGVRPAGWATARRDGGEAVQKWCKTRQNERPFCSSQFHSHQGIQAAFRNRLLQNAFISPHKSRAHLPPPRRSSIQVRSLSTDAADLRSRPRFTNPQPSASIRAICGQNGSPPRPPFPPVPIFLHRRKQRYQRDRTRTECSGMKKHVAFEKITTYDNPPTPTKKGPGWPCEGANRILR